MMNPFIRLTIFCLFSFLVAGCSKFASSPTPYTTELPKGGSLHATISWTAPTTAPTSYIIEAAIDNATYTQVGTATGSATSTTITGLSAVKYYFRVRSVNSIANTPSLSVVTDLSGL